MIRIASQRRSQITARGGGRRGNGRELQQRTEKDAEEPRLDQLQLPAEPVERLPDVADRDLQRAQEREHDRVGVAGQHRRRERGADPDRRRATRRRSRRTRTATAAARIPPRASQPRPRRRRGSCRSAGAPAAPAAPAPAKPASGTPSDRPAPRAAGSRTAPANSRLGSRRCARTIARPVQRCELIGKRRHRRDCNDSLRGQSGARASVRTCYRRAHARPHQPSRAGPLAGRGLLSGCARSPRLPGHDGVPGCRPASAPACRTSGSWPRSSRSTRRTSRSPPTRAAVDAFHAAALAAGGTDNGPPGLRADYHPHYYGAFVRDPEGNNVEVVCHADPDAKPAPVKTAARKSASKAKAEGQGESQGQGRRPKAKAEGQEAGRQEEAPLRRRASLTRRRRVTAACAAPSPLDRSSSAARPTDWAPCRRW